MALSTECRKYDQVEKAHAYQLAEHERDELDEDYDIAKLDIAPSSTSPQPPRTSAKWPS